MYDPIEERQICKFACNEMSRQIHRYIKGMSGSKHVMEAFEERLQTLSMPEKERAIARYIDLNRKVLNGLDFKMVLVRAIANYCDTFGYFSELLGNDEKMSYYLNLIQDKYIRYHEIFEANGQFGMKAYDGEILLPAHYEFIRTCYIYTDDLDMMPVIAQKNGKMGLVLPDGKETVVADFVYDELSLRDEYPYFEARKGDVVGKIERDGTFVVD